MAVTGPNTGFKIVNADGGTYTQDLGERYVSKDYLLDVYPNIAYDVLGNRVSAGLWVTGNNSVGQLGVSDTTDRSSPIQLSSVNTWNQIYFGQLSTAGIETDGSLWVWGLNDGGQLGLRDLVHRSSPTQVGSLTNWKQVSCAQYTMAAIKIDYTLWTWGSNSFGELGQNVSTATARSSPVQVGSLTNWSQVDSGDRHFASIKTNYTLWTWGRNATGGLGLNDATDRSSPTQVGSLTNWKLVSCGDYFTIALKTDGTLWSWGQNTVGKLGLNDTTNRSSPTQVGTLTNWKQIACGSDHVVALKTDGTLWSWGLNTVGALGDNSARVHRSSPTQIGSLTNWKQISIGENYIAALKTDGTLWSWGRNSDGQLGLSDLVHRSSPTQVGSLTNWRKVFGEGYSTGGLIDWSV